jgi:hypothetical protein
MSITELTELFRSTGDSSLSLTSSVVGMIVALILGLAISQTFMRTSSTQRSQSLSLTLTILPAVVAAVILLVGSNVARAFSMAGVFALIRFRSVPGDGRDILYILLASAVGLACGLGFLFYGILFTLILCLAMLLLARVHYGAAQTGRYHLKITVPESLNFQGAFDEILTQYTATYHLDKIRTADLGTVYEMTYTITLPNNADVKALLDALRCRNGNLDITLNLLGEHSESL